MYYVLSSIFPNSLQYRLIKNISRLHYYLNELITISIKQVTVIEAITNALPYFSKVIEIIDFVSMEREWVENKGI